MDSTSSHQKAADNLLIYKHGNKGKLRTRPGSQLLMASDPQLPMGVQRVGALINFDDDDALIASTGSRLYLKGDTSWQHLTGPNLASNSALNAGTIDNRLSWSNWNGHLFVTSDAYPSVIKVFRDALGVFQVRTAGLPKYTQATLLADQTGPDMSVPFWAVDTDTTNLDQTVASYIYAFVYRYTYKVNSVEFKDFSSPLEILINEAPSVGDVVTVNGAVTPPVTRTKSITLKNIRHLAPSLEAYDTANVVVEIYRTINGGTTHYKVGEVPSGTTTFTDTLTDDEIQSNEVLYITGNVQFNDPPPRASLIHVTDDTGFYADILEGTQKFRGRIRQSVRGDIDSCPEAFYVDIEEPIVGLSSVNGIPVALCTRGVYRIDGKFDELGRGGMSYQKISDTASCVSSLSVVQTLDGVFWVGGDGVYFTDGFRVIRINEELPELQKQLVSGEKAERIVGCYEPEKRLIHWGVDRSQTGTENDSLLTLHLLFGIRPHSTFTTSSGGESFKPTALCFYRGELIRGDSRGFVFSHSDSLQTDPEVNTVVSPSLWSSQAIVFKYESAAFNFGTAFVRKFVPKMSIACRNLSNLSLQILSNNDDRRHLSELTPIRFRGNVYWQDPLVVWGDPNLVWNYDGVIEQGRRFPAGGLRCNWKQIGLTNAKVVTLNSDAVGLVTVDKLARTVTLETGYGMPWPEDCAGFYLSFEGDGYSRDYLITSRTPTTVTVVDAFSSLVTGAAKKWVLRGIPKNEALDLISYTVHYALISSSQEQFKGSTGGNL